MKVTQFSGEAMRQLRNPYARDKWDMAANVISSIIWLITIPILISLGIFFLFLCWIDESTK